MNRKLREKLDSWDLRSVFWTVGIVTIVATLLFLFSPLLYIDIRDKFRNKDNENFKGQTEGKIISVEEIHGISQGRRGTRIYIDSYKVVYRFQASGKTIESIDIIPATFQNKKLLAEILEWKEANACLIKFDTNDPNKSVLIARE
jgi:hypothetical protein